MRYAIIGTGFVADYYMITRENHAALDLAGVFDINAARLKQFCDYYKVSAFNSLDDVLGDASIELIVVLTNPEAHFEISSAALAAGKHVYCEKPLAMAIDDARKLTMQAADAGLILAGAPANAYSDSFELVRRRLAEGAIGAPKLVYAEMEDGAIIREKWSEWRSQSGAAWPGQHEFEIGCTLEHAGYSLTWLIGLFGSIKRITGLSATLFMDKGIAMPTDKMAPDFSTAMLEFENGVVARLTCGLCAPRDRSMTIMGEGGTLTVDDVWNNRSNVYLEQNGDEPNFIYRLFRRFEWSRGRYMPFKPRAGNKVKYAGGGAAKKLPNYPSQIDFMAGPDAIRLCVSGEGKSRGQLSSEALHVTEAALALNRISEHDGRYEMTTSLASASGQA